MITDHFICVFYVEIEQKKKSIMDQRLLFASISQKESKSSKI